MTGIRLFGAGLLVQRRLANPLMETALVKHTEVAREVQHLTGELLALVRTTAIPTPTIDPLLLY